MEIEFHYSNADSFIDHRRLIICKFIQIVVAHVVMELGMKTHCDRM